MSEKIWQEVEFVGFDTETSGRYPLTAEICEVALVRWKNGQIISRYSQLIRPKLPLIAENIAIHGITNEMLTDAPSIEDCIADIHKQFEGAVGLAHHAPFDLGFLALEFERAGLSLPSDPVLCSSLLARKLIPSAPNHRLQTLIGFLQLTQGQAHRATDDSEACLGVMHKCWEVLGADAKLSSAFLAQGGALSWQRFSMLELKGQEKLKALFESFAQQSSVLLTYEGGSTPGEARVVWPHGLVRSLDGDYLVAAEPKDFKAKRYLLAKISATKNVA